MPQEVRYILFQKHEVEEAVVLHVAPSGAHVSPRRGPDLRIEFSDSEESGPRATVAGLIDPQGLPLTRRLNEVELRNAVLAWCRRRGVPLPLRGTKSIELVGAQVALTITLNAMPQEVRVEHGGLRYVDPALDTLRPRA